MDVCEVLVEVAENATVPSAGGNKVGGRGSGRKKEVADTVFEKISLLTVTWGFTLKKNLEFRQSQVLGDAVDASNGFLGKHEQAALVNFVKNVLDLVNTKSWEEFITKNADKLKELTKHTETTSLLDSPVIKTKFQLNFTEISKIL